MARGKPMVAMSSSRVWRISAGLAPACRARRVWEQTEPSDCMAAAAASWISCEVFGSSGPAVRRVVPSRSTLSMTSGNCSLTLR